MMTNELIASILIASLGSAGLWTLINNIYNNHAKEDETIKLLKEAQLATLQDRLLYLCSKYIEDGVLEANQLKSIHNLYKAYTSLGGNEFISDMMSRVNKLPIQ